MIVIYAEKYSLAKEIANALNAGNRIPYDKDNRICHWEFEFNGDQAILVHGQGHLIQLSKASSYGDMYSKWDINAFPCIPEEYKLAIKDNTKVLYNYIKLFFDKADMLINATDPDREG